MKCWAPNGRDLLPWPTGSGHTPDQTDELKVEHFHAYFKNETIRSLRQRAATNGSSMAEEVRRIVERGLRAK